MTTKTKTVVKKITHRNFTTSLLVDQSPSHVFQAINRVKDWWSSKMEGHSEKIHDVFTVHFGETYIKVEIVEWIPEKKINWLVVDCHKPWLKNNKEWVGTHLIWEITDQFAKTQIQFTHQGLVPDLECFGACSNAWQTYIQQSLRSLVTTGKGKPNPL